MPIDMFLYKQFVILWANVFERATFLRMIKICLLVCWLHNLVHKVITISNNNKSFFAGLLFFCLLYERLTDVHNNWCEVESIWQEYHRIWPQSVLYWDQSWIKESLKRLPAKVPAKDKSVTFTATKNRLQNRSPNRVFSSRRESLAQSTHWTSLYSNFFFIWK